MSAVGYNSTSEESANPTSATRSIASGRCWRKLRISDVARTSLDGAMSCARIDTDRSRTMMRSCRSNWGSRASTIICGRASAKTMAPANVRAAASTAARVRARVRRDKARNRGAIGEARLTRRR